MYAFKLTLYDQFIISLKIVEYYNILLKLKMTIKAAITANKKFVFIPEISLLFISA